jgi:alpha-D-ribose 1-methylphosphonate 5-triphosphate synthase subunit PhnH
MNANSLTHTLAAGLQDNVHESQFAFRQVLDALARPGQIRHIGAALPGVALGGAMARLLLSLTDDETAVHWHSSTPDDTDNSNLQTWLRFHTGAPVAAQASSASFVVVTQPLQAPALDSCAQGSPESPEFSSTVLMELPSLCRGPGIQDMQRVCLSGLPDVFWSQWQANHVAFPLGVDLIFTCAEHALGLPRTTRVRRLEGV